MNAEAYLFWTLAVRSSKNLPVFANQMCSTRQLPSRRGGQDECRKVKQPSNDLIFGYENSRRLASVDPGQAGWQRE
jgi:hypothetical protein